MGGQNEETWYFPFSPWNEATDSISSSSGTKNWREKTNLIFGSGEAAKSIVFIAFGKWHTNHCVFVFLSSVQCDFVIPGIVVAIRSVGGGNQIEGGFVRPGILLVPVRGRARRENRGANLPTQEDRTTQDRNGQVTTHLHFEGVFGQITLLGR